MTSNGAKQTEPEKQRLHTQVKQLQEDARYLRQSEIDAEARERDKALVRAAIFERNPDAIRRLDQEQRAYWLRRYRHGDLPPGLPFLPWYQLQSKDDNQDPLIQAVHESNASIQKHHAKLMSRNEDLLWHRLGAGLRRAGYAKCLARVPPPPSAKVRHSTGEKKASKTTETT